MEKMDIFWRIAELVIAVVGASVLTRVLTIRERVRQEKSNTEKADAEAKKEQIDNIRKTMEEVYRPIIEDLQKAVADARADADRACERVNELEEKVDALEKENRKYKRENEALNEKINELESKVDGTKRPETAKDTTRVRDASGRFVKKS